MGYCFLFKGGIMKKFLAKCLALALILLSLAFLISCKQEEKGGEDKSAEPLDFGAMSDGELERFAELGEYESLTVELGDASKGEAVWEAVRQNATVRSYPEAQVNYYVLQIEAQYKYYAEQADMSYEEMLIELGATDESILSQARSMAVDDVIYELVRRSADVTLEEREREAHFDRYVSKYVADYGYTEQYVKDNMKDEIYGSMLYDKVTEYLITHNEFE